MGLQLYTYNAGNNDWECEGRGSITPPPPPNPAQVVWSLDYSTNVGSWAGTAKALVQLIRTTYGNTGLGPYVKFYDGGAGVRTTINNLTSTGYGTVANEKSPVLCFKTVVAADLRFAFAWALTNFPNQPVYFSYWQEMEASGPTPAAYTTACQTMFSVRAENAAWVQWCKFMPILRGFKEVDNPTSGRTWQNYILPNVSYIDLWSCDIYDMDFYDTTWKAEDYVGPMITAAATIGLPWTISEWGTTVSQSDGSDTEVKRATRTQHFIDYCNSHAYDAVLNPNGIKWANYWENYAGIAGNSSLCTTGMVKSITVNGITPPTFDVLMTAMGR